MAISRLLTEGLKNVKRMIKMCSNNFGLFSVQGGSLSML